RRPEVQPGAARPQPRHQPGRQEADRNGAGPAPLPPQLKEKRMNEQEFDAKHQPIESPSQDLGSHFWSREEVLAALKAGTITEQQVWTVVDVDEGQCAAAGWHAVNFVAHMVTKVRWSDETDVADLDD